MQEFAAAIFLAIFNERLVEYIARPLKLRHPAWSWHLLLYISLLTGALIGWYSTLNLFAPFMPDPMIARFLTAVCIGAGSSFLHETFSSRPEVTVSAGTGGSVEANVTASNLPPDSTHAS
jgi:hypothetical protein